MKLFKCGTNTFSLNEFRKISEKSLKFTCNISRNIFLLFQFLFKRLRKRPQFRRICRFIHFYTLHILHGPYEGDLHREKQRRKRLTFGWTACNPIMKIAIIATVFVELLVHWLEHGTFFRSMFFRVVFFSRTPLKIRYFLLLPLNYQFRNGSIHQKKSLHAE